MAPTIQSVIDQSAAIRLGAEGVLSAPNNGKLKALILSGWQAAYTTLFGQRFIDGLAPHHIEAIEWHWFSRITFLEGGYPDYDAYFPIWSRAHNKSGVARRIAVMDGFLSFAYGQPAFILYLSRNKEMVLKHAKSVSTLLKSKRIRSICPELAAVKTDKEKKTKGWTAAFFYTMANVIFQFSGLDEGLAGGNLETDVNEDNEDEDDVQSDVRVTLFVPDDIDGREDTPTIAEGRFKTLTDEVLPMGQENTLTFFAQNLISRFSTMYRIYSQQARVLTGRKPTEPVKAVIDLKTEERTVDGIIKDIYVSGTPTWHVWDARRIQAEINRFGLPAFQRECQHEVEQSNEGRVHKKYDDNVHPVSYSQFAAVYGAKDAWKEWYKVPFSDWSRTKTKFHANVAGYLAVSSQNTMRPGFTFCIPFSFKANTSPTDVAERLLSALTPRAYKDRTWKDLIDEAWRRLNAETHFSTESERIEYLYGYYKRTIPMYSKPVLRYYNVHTGANSHSEDTVRQMFNDGFGFDFMPSNPRERDALDKIDEAQRVDYSLPHVFDDSKQGYTRWYVLCPDDKKAAPKIINGIKVFPPEPYPQVMKPDDLHDSPLFRYQMIERRISPPVITKFGEDAEKLLKLNDDYGQALQMVYFKELLSNIRLSEFEKQEMKFPRTLQFDAIQRDYEEGAISGVERAKRLNVRTAISGIQAQITALENKSKQKVSRR